MSDHIKKSVLILGGSGTVGSRAAKTLRRLHPDLPLTIGARDLDRAGALATEIGHATAAKIDLERPDLGLPAGAAFSAVVVLLKDESLHSLKYAQSHGLSYIAFSEWAAEIGPAVASYVHAPSSAPILFLGHILGGTSTLSALHFAKEFRRIDSIALGGVLDEDDVGGPVAQRDMERLAKGISSYLIRKEGKWHWADEGDARKIRGSDGAERAAQGMVVLDVVSLANATGAPSVRVDLALRDAASRAPGKGISHELIVEIQGEKNDGTTGAVRHAIVYDVGHSESSAWGVAFAVERLLGLAGGPPVGPGLYFPERLLDPTYVLERTKEFGARVLRS